MCHVLSEPERACTRLSSALCNPAASRDAASSAVLIAGAAIGGLPASHASSALHVALPHLIAWATSPHHTTRLLAQLVLQLLHTHGDHVGRDAPRDAARGSEGEVGGGGGAGEGGAGEGGAGEGGAPPPHDAQLLATLAAFFAAQPQNAAAAAAAMPYLRLPLPTVSGTMALMDARGTALAAGSGEGESAPPSTTQEVARVGAALVESSRQSEAKADKAAAEARLSRARRILLPSSVGDADAGEAIDGAAAAAAAATTTGQCGGEEAAEGLAQRKVTLGGLTGWGLEALLHDIDSAAAAADEEEVEVTSRGGGGSAAIGVDSAGSDASNGDDGSRLGVRRAAVSARRRPHELIVVASLVDRPQNLGGKCG